MTELSFREAFETYILNQRLTGWGFQNAHAVLERNGCYRDVGGYYAEYENGYRVICNDQNPADMPTEEVLILDQEGVPVAMNTVLPGPGF